MVSGVPMGFHQNGHHLVSDQFRSKGAERVIPYGIELAKSEGLSPAGEFIASGRFFFTAST